MRTTLTEKQQQELIKSAAYNQKFECRYCKGIVLVGKDWDNEDNPDKYIGHCVNCGTKTKARDDIEDVYEVLRGNWLSD